MDVILALLAILVSVIPLLMMFGVVAFLMWYGIRQAIRGKRAWRSLAEAYGFEGEFPAENRWRFRGGSVGGMYYRNGLTVAAGMRDLYMGMTMLSFGQKPLFFPWGELTVSDGRDFGFRVKVFAFRRVPGVLVKLSADLGEKLLGAGGQGSRAN